jgi:hypothetical protein
MSLGRILSGLHAKDQGFAGCLRVPATAAVLVLLRRSPAESERRLLHLSPHSLAQPYRSQNGRQQRGQPTPVGRVYNAIYFVCLREAWTPKPRSAGKHTIAV